jgi:glycosyltransferase involved in cell wall biosynthesis
MKLPISLVVITFNEERNLARCLESVAFAQEILVVDSFSTDQTLQIAAQYGAKTLQQKWLGFGGQKNFANKNTQHDWILSLDADEALSPELAQEIKNKFANLKPECAYSFPRKSFFLGRWIMHGGWYPDRQIRLFNKKHSQWLESAIHEKINNPNVIEFSKPLLHYVFKNVSHQVMTNDKYSSLQAQQLAGSGKTTGLFKIILKPIGKFVECYFLKLGFLDGMPGFIIAISAGYSMFLKWVKVWEIKKGLNQ